MAGDVPKTSRELFAFAELENFGRRVFTMFQRLGVLKAWL